MKPIHILLARTLACLLPVLFISCPPPGMNNPPPNLLTYPPYPGINILDNVIYSVNSDMEYSLDGQLTYIPCGGGIVNVTFVEGNDVWVRTAGPPPGAPIHLGTVSNIGNFPDLAPSNKIGLTSTVVAPGSQARILFKYYNIGAASADRYFSVSFYLSTDKNIEPGTDTHVITNSGTRTMSVGHDPEQENYYYPVDITIPGWLPYGTYYLGYVLDSDPVVNITELNEGNNISPPEAVAEIYITDTTPNTGGGAFKVVNSWGVGGWEHVADGHYWMTYQTVKALQLMCFYYFNDASAIYHPTAIAVFRITHPERNKCRVELGLGDPANPVMSKEFQPRYSEIMYSGAWPFPANEMALDVSEFVSMMDDTDLFLKITTTSGAAGGTVNSFRIDFYPSGNTTPSDSISCSSVGDFTGDAGVTAFTVATTGAVPGYVVPPVPRSILQKTTNPFLATKPTSEELAQDMARVGVSVPGQRYANVVDGRYGTGWAPPSASEWVSMNKLVGFLSAVPGPTPSNATVDHSASPYFPPIGDQGVKGSCAAWSTAYYTHTFYMARENNWDLSSTAWQTDSANGSPGYPHPNRDKIFSPDFIYHQINGGLDNGSSSAVAMTELINMGCSPWTDMEYNDQSDPTTWPSAAAFTKAAFYRGSDFPTLAGNLQYGYFIIRTDADINLLKTLLKNNYLVTCAIDAVKTDGDDWSLYDELNASTDVIDKSTFDAMHLNHAQTIVGFKDGTTWHPATPDD